MTGRFDRQGQWEGKYLQLLNNLHREMGNGEDWPVYEIRSMHPVGN